MSILSEKLREKIFTVLDGDGTLDTLAPGGVHHIDAPPNQSAPFIVFQAASPSVAVHASGNNKVAEKSIWFIKVISRSDTSASYSPESLNEAAIARIETLLDGYKASLTGATLGLMRHTGDIPTIKTAQAGEKVAVQSGQIYEATVTLP